MPRTSDKVIYPKLSFTITDLLFKVHNELGRFCREKQYADFFETMLKQEGIVYEREKALPIQYIDNQATNKVDFSLDNKILIDFKAKPLITKEDYYQMQRYLAASGFKLGLIVNFRNTYLKPTRVIHFNL